MPPFLAPPKWTPTSTLTWSRIPTDAIGGWQNCRAARCTIPAVPSFRDRIPVIVGEVTTLCGPGELIDVVVTERGIAINPRRQDLLDTVKGSKLPFRALREI